MRRHHPLPHPLSWRSKFRAKVISRLLFHRNPRPRARVDVNDQMHNRMFEVEFVCICTLALKKQNKSVVCVCFYALHVDLPSIFSNPVGLWVQMFAAPPHWHLDNRGGALAQEHLPLLSLDTAHDHHHIKQLHQHVNISTNQFYTVNKHA
jgi:hypothetical protein